MSARWRIVEGDCVEAMRAMDEASVDAVVCDPPYGLEFMGRKWDKLDGANGFRRADNPADVGRDSVFGRASARAPQYIAGSRIQAWHEAWAREALRVLRPGGHLLAFGGTRTYHRLACAIEDAGFEIRDTIAWMYGSGFPKSLDVSKAIDARGGNAHRAREIAAAIRQAREARGWTTGQADRHFCNGSTNWTWYEGRKGDCRPPTTTDFARIAAEWPELAPLAEMVAAAERDVVGQSAHRSGIGNGNAGHYTVGGTVAEHVDITAPATPEAERWQGWGTALKPAHEPVVVARKPLAGTVAANVLAHGTGALNVDGTRIGTEERTNGAGHLGANGIYGRMERNDSETIALGRWPANVVLDPEAAAILDEQTGELTSGKVGPEGFHGPYRAEVFGKYAENRIDPATVYGDSGGASRFFYVAKASSAERSAGLPDGERSSHPTVKPIDLMRWLVRLVTPPDGLVLDPFTGSGSTGCAAALEGVRFVGIEREPEYAAIARARIAWWAKRPPGLATDLALASGQHDDAVRATGQDALFGDAA